MDTKTPDYNDTLAKCAEFFLAWTGYRCDRDTAELLTMHAFDYYSAMSDGDYSDAQLALESTLSYVNTEMTTEQYDEYIDMFEDYLSCG
jgi:hypothetical protein